MTERVLQIKVIPRAKKTELIGYMDDGSLKIRLKAIPEDGKANIELCRFLTEFEWGEWEVVGGKTGTRKVVRRVD